MPDKASSGATRAVRLLLKAIRGLPEREQQAVLAYLLEQGFRPPEVKAHEPFGPAFMTPAFVKEVGGVAGGMLRSGQGVAGIAGLYGIPEEAVRAALHEVVSNPEAPQPLASILELLADGRPPAKAARELEISKEEMTDALAGLPSSRLESRLGTALFTYARMRAQASSAFAFTAARPHQALQTGPREPGVLPADPDGLAARLGRLLLADSDAGQIAAVYGVPEHAVRAALREVAADPTAPEPLASILKLVADGHKRAAVADELGISEEGVISALEELLPSPLNHRLSQALQTSVAVRSVGPPPSLSLGPGAVVSGALGSGAQQMVPVRFPEPQYVRLKDWCGRHGFSMAVVVRGLVERFLDDQERRAA